MQQRCAVLELFAGLNAPGSPSSCSRLRRRNCFIENGVEPTFSINVTALLKCTSGSWVMHLGVGDASLLRASVSFAASRGAISGSRSSSEDDESLLDPLRTMLLAPRGPPRYKAKLPPLIDFLWMDCHVRSLLRLVKGSALRISASGVGTRTSAVKCAFRWKLVTFGSNMKLRTSCSKVSQKA